MRTIAVLTTSRADFGHLYWPLARMREHPDLDPRLIVTGAHLSPAFGHTVDEIRAAGFAIEDALECLLSSDTDVGMAKTTGLATISLADTLARMRPDILLLIADRYEMLAPATAALALRIPMAHIEGGEISEGAVDDAVRHALTKLAHLHFVPTCEAARRVRAMGEEPWRIHRTGAPSLDHLRHGSLATATELREAVGMDVDRDTCVVAIHPVTLDADTTSETAALFAALDQLRRPVVFCFPNADAGSYEIMGAARDWCERHADARLVVNLGPRLYWALLRDSGALVGNSSSGIMETASLGLPTVNVGRRQAGRTRPGNVVDVPAEPGRILIALREAFEPGTRERLTKVSNPYGDGHAGERIAEALAAAPAKDVLLHKRALPLIEGEPPAFGERAGPGER
jgi:UDP-N-acetylglucosamine 2-epimerase (non-hydrolysing)/GDP/UDP-N,N'-diacetylbacillosamine 2-epimerase (hydrolysing)